MTCGRTVEGVTLITELSPHDPAAQRLRRLIEGQLDEDKAEDVVVIDLAGKTSFADYMIIASGRSTRQVGSMADHLKEKIKAADLGDVRMEGESTCDWVLIDAGDVIVHLFRPEVRSFYNLEKMWSVGTAEAAHA